MRHTILTVAGAAMPLASAAAGRWRDKFGPRGGAVQSAGGEDR